MRGAGSGSGCTGRSANAVARAATAGAGAFGCDGGAGSAATGTAIADAAAVGCGCGATFDGTTAANSGGAATREAGSSAKQLQLPGLPATGTNWPPFKKNSPASGTIILSPLN